MWVRSARPPTDRYRTENVRDRRALQKVLRHECPEEEVNMIDILVMPEWAQYIVVPLLAITLVLEALPAGVFVRKKR